MTILSRSMISLLGAIWTIGSLDASPLLSTGAVANACVVFGGVEDCIKSQVPDPGINVSSIGTGAAEIGGFL
jgi:hypothetical protein